MKNTALFLTVLYFLNLNCHKLENPVDAPPAGPVESEALKKPQSSLTLVPQATQTDAVPPRDVFDITGIVFVDADENGTKSSSESGIPNVTVTLADAGNNVIETVSTSAGGDYLFRQIPGTYVVRIDPVSPVDAFNERLAASFNPTTPTSLIITIDPDSEDNNFGYAPKTHIIIEQIISGAITSKSRPVKFWKRQFKAALQPVDGSSVYDSGALLSFLSDIEDLYIQIPYQFTAGNELQEALEILCDESDDEVKTLLKELLVAELNEVSGSGINNSAGLQGALISWGEALVNQNLRPNLRLAAATLSDAIAIFRTLNSSGGGGGIGT